MKVVTMKTETRDPEGTASARRLRRSGRVPAVVYGDGAEPVHVSLDTREFSLAVERGARVIDLDGGDGATRVLLKDLQFDALGLNMIHADFVRVNPEKEIELRIPIDRRGVPVGLSRGGILSVASDAILVRCLPADLPEGVIIDITGMKLGDSVTAGDIPLPDGVVCADDPLKILITMLIPRGVSADDEEAGEGEGDGEAEGGDAEAPADG